MTDQPKPKRKRWPIILLGLVGLCLLMALIGSLGGGGDTDAPAALATTVRNTATPRPPTATSTPRPLAPTFQEIETTVEGMTEAQWKPYLESLKGQRVVDWTGWVVDVNQKLGGAYEAWIDMDDPGMFTIQDVYVPVDSDTALALGKGEPVTFSGVIKSANELLGNVTIHLEEATVTAP